MTPTFILFLFSSLVKPPKRAKSVRSHWEGQELTQTGHTAAHRRSRWSLQLLEGLGDPLPLCSQFYPLQLSGVGFGDHILNWPEGEQKISAVPTTGFGGDLGRLGGDKLPLLQSADALAHRVLTHAHRLSNRFDAGPALMRLTVLAPFEVTIHCQFTGIQTQQEDLVGQREVGSTSVPDFPPPVCSSPSG